MLTVTEQALSVGTAPGWKAADPEPPLDPLAAPTPPVSPPAEL